MEAKKAGPPAKDDDEKQQPFTVSCKKKNVEVIKPMVKEWVKELDKKDWSKDQKQ